VQLLHGGESCLYIHVEIQSARQKEFAKRMFIYNYRIFDIQALFPTLSSLVKK